MAADEQKSIWIWVLAALLVVICVYAGLIATRTLDEPDWMYNIRHWQEDI